MRLIRGKWVDEYDPTIEDSYSTSRTVDGRNYRLDIIDTAGQEEYRDMLSSLCGDDVSGYMLVYDVTSRRSLEHLEYFDELIEKNTNYSNSAVKMVAANKIDLVQTGRAVVKNEEGQAWATAHGCGFTEMSAKLRVNIEEAFEWMVRQVVEKRGIKPIRASEKTNKSIPASTTTAVKTTPQKVTAQESESVKRSSCCVIT